MVAARGPARSPPRPAAPRAPPKAPSVPANAATEEEPCEEETEVSGRDLKELDGLFSDFDFASK